jgi:threonine dehydrogenase-like Zn-dependent dehydrogenase
MYEDALRMVRSRGRLLAFGTAPRQMEMTLRPFEVFAKEFTIMGSYTGTYETRPEAIDLIASGRLDPSGIIETVRPLEEAEETVRSLDSDKSIANVFAKVGGRSW